MTLLYRRITVVTIITEKSKFKNGRQKNEFTVDTSSNVATVAVMEDRALLGESIF